MQTAEERDYADVGKKVSDLAGCLGHAVYGLILSFANRAVDALAFWFLWNAFIPALFHLPALAFWQAFGILVLIDIAKPPMAPGERIAREILGKKAV